MSNVHRFIPEIPVDHVARETIANWIDQTLFVEAAAGTGKTTSMVERMLTLIRRGESVSRIAAITFTRKAAAELRGRFYQRLQRAAADAMDEQEAERFASAIDELDRCTIGTIHSFCSGLLRQRPFEAGVGMNFTELDADAEDLLLDRAWHDFVSECIADGTYTEKMVELAMTFEQLAPSFKTFCGYADVDHWPAGEASDVELDLDALHREVEAYAGHMQSLWPKLQTCDPREDKLIPLYLQFPRTVRAKKLLPPGELLDYLCNLREDPKNTQKNWGEDKASKELGKEEASRWQSFHRRVIAPIIPVFRSKRYVLVMEIFHQAREVYAERRRRRGMLSFQDLLLKAAAMLRDHETVRRHFAEQAHYLLIDEFQDTDPIQAEIMMLLTSDDLSESDWTRCHPRPGALFVVGDPKQSIYRFRRADIGMYQMVRQQVLASGGQAVSLTTNFRSSRSVVDWVNGIFGKDDPDFFGSEATDLQAAATEMNVGRDAPELARAATINGVYRLELGSERVDDLLEEDADRIARFIRHAIDSGATILDFDRDGVEVVARPRPVRPGDFMILTYRLKHLSAYAEALVRAGLDAQVTGGGQLNETVEIEWLCRTIFTDSSWREGCLTIVATSRICSVKPSRTWPTHLLTR